MFSFLNVRTTATRGKRGFENCLENDTSGYRRSHRKKSNFLCAKNTEKHAREVLWEFNTSHDDGGFELVRFYYCILVFFE